MKIRFPKRRIFHMPPWFPFLLGVATVSFILLFLGFSSVSESDPQLATPLSKESPSLTLTTGESLFAAANLLLNGEFIKPSEMNLRNLQIMVGQLLGFIAFYGILLRIAWLFLGDSIRTTWVRFFYCYHTVICDLNSQGQAFIFNLRENNPKERIVALLEKVEDEDKYFCKQYGITLVQGSPKERSELQRVAIHKAKALIACGASPDTNLQIAKAVEGALDERLECCGQLGLYLSLSDALLADGLGNENYQHFLKPGMKLNPYLYSAENLIARHYFTQYPPHTWADWNGQNQVHLVFAGFGPLVESLIYQYAQISPYKNFLAPVFTLLGPDAEKNKKMLVARYPALKKSAEEENNVIDNLIAVECDQSFKLTEGLLKTVSEPALPTAVLFCESETDLNFHRAISLHQQTLRFNQWRVPFYLHLCQNEGVQALLASAKSKHPADQLISFGMAEEVFDLNILAEVEENACSIHEAYKKQMEEENTIASWSFLAETYRAANRRAGDHIAVKLASIGCHVESGKPLVLSGENIVNLVTEKCDQLSRLEHRSWRYERLLNGWRFGDERNNRQRIHPSIILWGRLLKDEIKKDEETIKNVIKTLKSSPVGGERSTVKEEIVIGLVGHNRITVEQGERVIKELRNKLVDITESSCKHFVTLVTPLAPGSDFILAYESLKWLKKQGISHRLLIVQALALDKVVDEYKDAWNKDGSWNGEERLNNGNDWKKSKIVIQTELQNFIDESEKCEQIIDLTLEGDKREENDDAFQRAADWIVNRADKLIAVQDPSRGEGGKGGTAATINIWNLRKSKYDLKIIDIRSTV